MKRKTRTNLKVEHPSKGDETMRSSEARYRRGLDNSPRRGVPVVLSPSLSLRAAETLHDGLDDLLLSGGPDLDPGYYGEGPIPELGTTIPEWDALEMALLRLALGQGMPIFGICRGMQILNVALGGTLHQDV